MSRTCRGTALAAGALAAFVSVSCGSDQVGGSRSASAPPAGPTVVTSPTVRVPAGSAAPSSLRPSIQPGAKDGTNYQASRGGDCAIAVAKPVTITVAGSPGDIGADPTDGTAILVLRGE